MKRYKKEEKERVIALRLEGKSLGYIQSQIKIPKATIYSWLKGVKLQAEHTQLLRSNTLIALQEGRVRFQKLKKDERTSLTNSMFMQGIGKVGQLSDRDLFIAGVALYWGEGFKNKHESRLGFCNSDPAMVKFYLNWLKKCLGVHTQDIVARVTINKIHEKRTREIEIFWSQQLQIPLNQFTKPFYQKSVWQRQYHDNNYYGVIRIHVVNSINYLLEMRGWIEGLKICQGSSVG